MPFDKFRIGVCNNTQLAHLLRVVIQARHKHLKNGLHIMRDLIPGRNFRPENVEAERRITREDLK
jgi:hypothetical protein